MDFVKPCPNTPEPNTVCTIKRWKKMERAKQWNMEKGIQRIQANKMANKVEPEPKPMGQVPPKSPLYKPFSPKVSAINADDDEKVTLARAWGQVPRKTAKSHHRTSDSSSIRTRVISHVSYIGPSHRHCPKPLPAPPLSPVGMAAASGGAAA